ncbi:MAG: large subunit ribosomal protein [Thermoleophilaceae bacterium]|nr:large subunit ribosomal protein [Thermoleophilaceae bacterium]MEA2349498.1 large subunit ribosomal protein [Thermoleophilaceae bacterium]MEA2353297.1 large subunit ribosomal protein [Thermoleophilaceae bacterium]MEA2367927.1 large subunit ribosomal protein [Thermoleophilaceae bacterium]MEA2388631.1 large subunit ribosomal protein [Thermoleophilaceae bacterium]
MAARVKKDDMVKVISGKDKGKTGRVLRVEPKSGRVFVEGMNIQKRHSKPRTIRDVQRGGEVGGVIEKEGPIHLSNVMPLDPKTGDPTRVGAARDESGRTVRVGRRSGERFE